MGIKKRMNYHEAWILASIRGTTIDKIPRDKQGGYRSRLSREEINMLERYRKNGEYSCLEYSILNNGETISVTTAQGQAFLPISMNGAIKMGNSFFRNTKGEELRGLDEISSAKSRGTEWSPKAQIESNKAAVENKRLKSLLMEQQEIIDQYEALAEIKSAIRDVEVYDIVPSGVESSKETTAIMMLSDIHADEFVNPDSVLGLNEYNPTIAKRRLESYFVNATKLITHHQRSYHIEDVVLNINGDLLSGWIHPELTQTNTMAPLEAVAFLKSTILSGMKYLQENLNVKKITVVGMCGNHGRTTPKIQHSNFTQTNLEYFLYEDLRDSCRLLGLNKFEFIIPKASMAVVEIYGKRYLFGHGHFFRYMSGVGGIYVPLLRWFNRIANLLKVERAFISHWHMSVSIKEAVVNGSVIGYNSFAMDLGLPFEVPQQQLSLLNRKRGFTNQQSIYLD